MQQEKKNQNIIFKLCNIFLTKGCIISRCSQNDVFQCHMP